MSLRRLQPLKADNCSLPFEDPSGNRVVLDVQSAEPGTFTVPAAFDLETYEFGSMIQTSWIYWKGSHYTGAQPGHPLEKPFDNLAKFSLDMVRDDDTSKVLREIMREPLYIGRLLTGILTCHHSARQFSRLLGTQYAIYCMGSPCPRHPVARRVVQVPAHR